jgi:hypothetical protein
MGYMDALGPQLACHALGQGAQAVLGAGEGGKAVAPTQAGGGASEQNCAPPARQHAFGGLAPHQKPAKQAISQTLK